MTYEQLASGTALAAKINDLKDYIQKVKDSSVMVVNDRGNEIVAPPCMALRIHPEQMERFKKDYLALLYAHEDEMIKEFEGI